MLLVQKAPGHSFSSPYQRGVVHVQPTATPGLLSLSKPTKTVPRAIKQRSPVLAHQSPANRKENTNTRSTGSPSAGRRSANRNPTPPLFSAFTPSGSTQANTDSLDPFLDSSSSANTTPKSSPRRKSAVPATPTVQPTTLTSQPSGKLARRRGQPQPPSPTPVHANAKPANSSPKLFRRSPAKEASPAGPVLSRPTPRRALTINGPVVPEKFPICDDLTDAEGEDEVQSVPSTPVRRFAAQAALGNGGPQTAPLVRAAAAFPFGGRTPHASPSPAFAQAAGNATTPKPRRQTHVRSPSYNVLPSSKIDQKEEEGVFHMSSDEETSGGSSSQKRNLSESELKLSLFGILPARPSFGGRKAQSTSASMPGSHIASGNMGGHRASASYSGHSTSLPTSSTLHASFAEAEKKPFFAGSAFQDSPSPEELPPPSFV